MRIQHPFGVITSSTDGDVLTALARVDGAFTVPQLSRVIGHRSREGIRKALDRLIAEGTVLRSTVGRTHQYKLNRDHLAAPAILDLACIRDRFLIRLGDALSAFEHPPTYAALFGSAARNEMRPDSDIDLFVVRPAAIDSDGFDDQLTTLIPQVTKWTGNDVRPLLYDEGSLSAGDPVLHSIRDEGITLVGDPAWFRQRMRSLQP